MKKGVLLFARNNNDIDYVKQAVYCAKQIKKYLNLEVALATDIPEYLEKTYQFYKKYIDYVIPLEFTNSFNFKTYNDGSVTKKRLEFKNDNRHLAYDITPFDETILMDVDIIVNDKHLLHCFEQSNNFLIYKDAMDLSFWRDTSEFDYISDTSVDFYWATCVFFRKTKTNKIFFDLVAHIKENYAHYNHIFQLTYTTFRNDHAFSIAIHIMNGYTKSNFASPMPGKLFFTSDKDILIEYNDNTFKFLIEKEKCYGEYTPISFSNNTVHIMNKYSLDRLITKDLKNE